MWSSPSLGTMMWRANGELYLAEGKRWLLYESPIAEALRDRSFPHMVLPPQPSEVAFAQAASNDGSEEQLYVFLGNQVVVSRDFSDLTREVCAMGVPTECELELNTATEQKVYLTIKNRSTGNGSVLYGFAVLDAQSLKVVKVTKLNVPQDTTELGSAAHFIVVPDGDSEQSILVFSLNNSTQHAWVALRLLANSVPQQIATHPYLIQEVSPGADSRLTNTFNSEISGVTWLPPKKLLINCNADSIYLLDLETNRLSIIFHPGGELLVRSVNMNGLAAIYMPGGYKCYIFQTGQ